MKLTLHGRGKALWLPLDNALIAGPTKGLAMTRTLVSILGPKLDGIISFVGSAKRTPTAVPKIVNLTASTVLVDHTSKVQVTSVAAAKAAGAAAVAVHLNIGSPSEQQQMQTLGRVVEEAGPLALPVVAIAYSRTVTSSGIEVTPPEPKLVAHAVRVAVELGADAVKTTQTPSFDHVVRAAMGVPVLVAGGLLRSDGYALERARQALDAGAAGVAYGRQIHQNDDPVTFVNRLREVLDR
jgi:DhnA family fructose-bisphosphate aldolase class Ia